MEINFTKGVHNETVIVTYDSINKRLNTVVEIITDIDDNSITSKNNTDEASPNTNTKIKNTLDNEL